MTIENAIAKAPNAIWVLLNPLLEDTVDSYTFGHPLSLHILRILICQHLSLSLSPSLPTLSMLFVSRGKNDVRKRGRVCTQESEKQTADGQ